MVYRTTHAAEQELAFVGRQFSFKNGRHVALSKLEKMCMPWRCHGTLSQRRLLSLLASCVRRVLLHIFAAATVQPPISTPFISCLLHCSPSLFPLLNNSTAVTMPQATLGDMSGLERYLAADGESKKFDMVDGGEYDGDKACECRVILPGFPMEGQGVSIPITSTLWFCLEMAARSICTLDISSCLQSFSYTLQFLNDLRLGFMKFECLRPKLEFVNRSPFSFPPRRVQGGGH